MTPGDADRRPILEAGRPKRLELIKRLQELRKSRVICLLISDRPDLSGNLAQDILPAFSRIVDGVAETEPGLRNLDLWLYGPGGFPDPISAIYGCLDSKLQIRCKVNVLVPYKAASALTFLTFGADSVLMGDMGQLSPIDAQMNLHKKGELVRSFSVEDIRSLFKFSRELLGVKNGAAALQPVMSRLLRTISPSLVGRVRRIIEHSRLLGVTLLRHRHRRDPSKCPPEKQLQKVTECFTSMLGSHGHPIFCEEARRLGLDFVKRADRKVNQAIWELYESYASDLDLECRFLGKEIWNSSNPPVQERVVFKNACLGLLESETGLWAYTEDLVLRREVLGSVNIPLPQLQIQANPPISPDQLQLLTQAVQQAVAQQIAAARNTLPHRVLVGRQNAGWTKIC
jgi:hypothetical protein